MLHLIFDFDGLILDTESAIYEAWRELYASHGHGLTLATWSQCVGSDFSHAYDPKAELEQLTGQAFDWTVTEAALTARVGELLMNYPVLPGVRELLEAAQAASVPCAVASSSPLSWVGGHLARLGLRSYFTHVTTREEVARVKPAPDLFLKAAEKFSAASADCLVLEDSLNGYRAATAASMRCIICAGPTTAHLNFEGAWRVVGSLSELSVGGLLGEHGT